MADKGMGGFVIRRWLMMGIRGFSAYFINKNPLIPVKQKVLRKSPIHLSPHPLFNNIKM
jgi:hypothetical protein